ncbi:Methyltransferase domain-containing protein [Halomicrobium zhouii]|uniref:Methyltransferase domain-containing protein n=1 Tax=Halomicrobium zhouii TaxID=767519 RepID=A0A1I6KLU2_9EURY|nr:methyltransferase domain-containing protein [Halomicrobium zhouii]SFR91860.1 Methyltransferase domain-containing protein [Halomicrobium zhouii]
MSDATRAFYGRWARLYDVLATLPGVSSWRESAAGELGLARGDLAVEMGCGTGANLPHLRERVGPDGRVVGLDVTREMLERARGRGDADLLQADAARPPLSEPVDGLLGTFVVAMFTDPGAVVDRWCDLVRPSGRVALLHFTRSERAWARPVNAGYRAFVWLSSTDKSRVRDVASSHDRRVDAGLEALAARTTDYRERTLAGGYLRLASGQVT